MIWFFIAGFISGAVGMILYANWWMHRHTKVIKLRKEEENDNEQKDGNIRD